VALVSREAVRFDIDAGRLAIVPIPGTPMRRPWHAVCGLDPTPVVRLFVKSLLAAPDKPRWRSVTKLERVGEPSRM
jgi:DNA-binding transcriptional LysR family regulator